MSQSVLITGSSRGIGKACALRLARDGFDVVVHCRSARPEAEAVAAEIRALGRQARVLQFDVADRERARTTLLNDIEAHGCYYGVVLNAGIARDNAFPAMPGEDWDAVLRVDLDGFYNVLQPLVMPMIHRAAPGRIVTMASVSGQIGNRGQVNYSAAKGGVIAATKALAVELAKRAITVNCVAPGLIETDMTADVPKEIKDMIPLRRFGKSEEVASLVSYLLSEGAAYITRQVIGVNGGLSFMKRVVVTGMAGISPLGCDWATVAARLKAMKNAVVRMDEWAQYKGLNTNLAAPAADFEKLPADRYSRKHTRSMDRVALLAVRASDLALEDAGLSGAPVISSGATGVAYGSSTGGTKAVGDFARMLHNLSTDGITATTYIRMMGHTAPVNIGIFFKAKGRIITTSSACTSGSQAIGYSYEAIKTGKQLVMIAGGAEELSPTEAAVFDTLFATSTRNDTPEKTPSPFDRDRDGLVIGEGAGTLILEELEHARARGARIYAEILGFGTNSDGWHVTHPNAETMQAAIQMALDDAGVSPGAIGYVNAHGTATDNGDVAETTATAKIFGSKVPFSSLKSYMGHTLGACGALEAWMTVMMMREGWAAPTLNLNNVDPLCGDLDYIRGAVRPLSCDTVMSNNFAFGGINTSLIFKNWSAS